MMPIKDAALICRIDMAITREIERAGAMAVRMRSEGNAKEAELQYAMAMTMCQILGHLEDKQFGDDLENLGNSPIIRHVATLRSDTKRKRKG